MLSSSNSKGECNCSCNKKSINNKGSSSSSFSSTTTRLSLSPSSSSTPNVLQTPKSNKTMEDVWKDINLASLTDHSTHHTTTTTTSNNLPDVNFQDFLTPPLTFTIAIDPPTTSNTVSSSPSNTSSSLHSPLTALSLSSHHFEPLSHEGLQLAQPHASKVDPLCNPFQSQLVQDSCDSLSSFGNKRFLESDDGNSRDRRTKRMMKNRESAARSRARKQAYTFELQQKIELLLAENARLRTQHQRLLCDAAANQQQNKKGNLYRTSTAPF